MSHCARSISPINERNILTKTPPEAGGLLGIRVTESSSCWKVVSSSCDIHAARSIHRHPVQYSIEICSPPADSKDFNDTASLLRGLFCRNGLMKAPVVAARSKRRTHLVDDTIIFVVGGSFDLILLKKSGRRPVECEKRADLRGFKDGGSMMMTPRREDKAIL